MNNLSKLTQDQLNRLNANIIHEYHKNNACGPKGAKSKDYNKCTRNDDEYTIKEKIQRGKACATGRKDSWKIQKRTDYPNPHNNLDHRFVIENANNNLVDCYMLYEKIQENSMHNIKKHVDIQGRNIKMLSKERDTLLATLQDIIKTKYISDDLENSLNEYYQYSNDNDDSWSTSTRRK